MQEMRDKQFNMQAPHFVNTFAVGYSTIGNFIQDVSAAVGQTFDEIDEDERASYSSSKLRLLVGGTIVNDIRKAVFEETGYTCSAGIAHNKILAKLICGMNKPNKQTILPLNSISDLFEKLDISKIKSMGGKTGEEVRQKLNVKFVNDLLKFSENELKQHFGDRIGNFLFLIARGIDLEKVRLKINSKSIGVSKNFLGPSEITNINTLKYWLSQLSEEVKERLDSDALETNRIARQLTVQFTQFIKGKAQSSTRVVNLNGNILNNYLQEEIANECYETIEKLSKNFLKIEGKCLLNYGIRHLGITAGKFEDRNSYKGNIQNFFNKKQKSDESSDDESSDQDEVNNEKVEDVKNYPELSEENNEEKVTENSAIRVKSEHELKGTFKKYERDSQACTPVICEEPISNDIVDHEEDKIEEVISYNSENDNSNLSIEDLKNEDEEDFDVSRSFHGDNAIRGIETLKFSICELLRKLDKKLLANNKFNRAPEEIEIHFVQIINGIKMKLSESIPLFILSEDTISSEFIFDTMKETHSNFLANDNLLNPIIFLEIKPTKFKDNSIWKLKLHEEKSVEEIKKNLFTDNQKFLDETQAIFMEESDEIANLEQSFLEAKEHDEPKPSTSKDASCLNSAVELKSLPYLEAKEYDEPKPSTSKDQSYLDSFVELKSRISLDDLNPLEECLECGKMIRKFEMLTHIDGHIAMKLAQRQREEYRADKKQSTSANQKQPGKSSQKPKKVFPFKNSIEKFTVKQESFSESIENQVMCDECYKLVVESEYHTHKDYHFAQKLRKEQMDNALKSNESNKRKRPTSTSTSTQKKVKSVKDFFN